MNIAQMIVRDVRAHYAAQKQLDYDVTRSENGKSLNPISRSHAKRIALAYAKHTRAHRFDRVSKSFLAALESNALSFIKDRVNRQASRGKTLV
jgi:hypothetical protein